MPSSFAIAAIAFGLIFPVELPDKTFVATLVLSTRFRPLHVWLGVSAAFLVQTVLSCTLGGLLIGLPKTPVQAASALLFLIGGIILIRGAARADAEEAEAEREFEEKADHAVAAQAATPWRSVVTSFLVLLLAEFGDLSQILTANLVLQYRNPIAVGIGAWTALATVSALGAVAGRQLLRRIPLATVRRIGGTVCLLLATWTCWELLSPR